MLIFRLNFERFSFQLLYLIMFFDLFYRGKSTLSQTQVVNIQHAVLMLLVVTLLMKENLLRFESEMAHLVLTEPGELMHPLPLCATASPGSL